MAYRSQVDFSLPRRNVVNLPLQDSLSVGSDFSDLEIWDVPIVVIYRRLSIQRFNYPAFSTLLVQVD